MGIDLEAEEKKYLILTENEEISNSNTFSELSPTDYQLDGICLPTVNGDSVAGSSLRPINDGPGAIKQAETGTDAPRNGEDQTESGQPKYGGGYSKYKGRGGKFKQGFSKMNDGSLDQRPDAEERRERNSYRKNHYQNRGKSYNQQKKIKHTKTGGADL